MSLNLQSVSTTLSEFALDHRLAEDSHLLGYFDSSILLLMQNALFPWFVLVPYSREIEFYMLDLELQINLLQQINMMSKFIEDNYPIDKINIASIGNIVSQLHVHIIGRSRSDACWPNVVWGAKEFEPYQPEQVAQIKQKLADAFSERFRVHSDDD